MGKQKKVSEMSIVEQLTELHSSIEMHMMIGIQLSRLMDYREESRSTSIWPISEETLQRRIENLADVRKSLRSDMCVLKDLIKQAVENIAQPHLKDVEVLEFNL